MSHPKKREPSKQAWKAVVSLEFDLQPVLTWRGEVPASSVGTAARRAFREARVAFKGTKPRSYVLVLEAV